MKIDGKYLLGISAGYHDSAAALIKDGKVLGAVEEERFTGIKHDSSFPSKSIEWLLEDNNITGKDIFAVCYYENPNEKIDRIKTSLERGGFKNILQRPRIVYQNQQQVKDFEKLMVEHTHSDVRIVWGDHHFSHTAYSYYTSGFQKSAIVTVDGVGEWDTIGLFYGEGNKITRIDSIQFPTSLGMLYSTFTAFLGFKPLEGEYKVMGLAPYGNPDRYKEEFEQLYTLEKDGKFSLNMDYFVYDWNEKEMFNEKLSKLFGISNRLPDENMRPEDKDIAAGLQYTYEKLFFRILDQMFGLRPTNNLCLGGGSAYNGTANGKIHKKTQYKNLWIPPAPSDSGSAIGAALFYYYTESETDKRIENKSPFLGPYYSNEVVEDILKEYEDDVYYVKKTNTKLIDHIAGEITRGNVVGWFEGKLEFGARALGNRSILANPRDPQMKQRLNRVVKKRETFRPFAPIVKEEDMTNYFDYKFSVPYMNQVVHVKEEHQKDLPAITHVDGSARIQTLNNKQHNRMYSLLTKLKEVNKYPIVLNTSFNLKDQTMVRDPKTAIDTFLDCEMDTLVIHNYVIKKNIK